MFISKFEKAEIQNAIDRLRFGLGDATTEIIVLKAKIKVLEEKAQEIKTAKPTEAELKEELKKAKKRAYARDYYHRKKEGKQVFHVGS